MKDDYYENQRLRELLSEAQDFICFSDYNDKYKKAIAARIESALMGEPSDRDGKCYYCGEMTNHYSGNPGLWPVMLCYKEDPGKPKHHHTKCISLKLAEK